MDGQRLMINRTMELKQSKSNFAEKIKKEALAKFNSIPMPKEKEEDWRYTFIDKFSLEKFDKKESTITAEFDENIVEKGVIITDINTALESNKTAREYFLKKISEDKFAAYSIAFFSSGYFVYIPKNAEIKEPIRIKVDGSSVLCNLIVADINSNVQIEEEYSGNGENEQLNAVLTEAFSNVNSSINFNHISNWGKNTCNFTNINGTIQKDGNINWISGCFGGKINRLKINTFFEGSGANCNNLGIFLGKGKEHVDFTTNVYHNSTNTTNNILVDGILKDEATSVYRGLIRIPKEGQQTNSYLANHVLKLGDKTIANSIPGLKIDANDVKASHGATVGQINEEHLFYLMARGLSRQEAERLIVEGFFEPVIQKIPSEELREKIREMVR